MNDIHQAFSNPEHVAKYTEGPPRFVPGYTSMLSMARLLLAERAGDEARVLILGAGGGLEMRTFAQAQPNWTFDGVDPSLEMLNLAKRTMGSLAMRARLHLGYIKDAPDELFDATTCLLTLHFVPPQERLHTLREVRRRLKPGAPFVLTHFSVPGGENERALWFSRFGAFVAVSSVDPDSAANASAAPRRLHILAPEQDEATLRDAGFSDVALFYAGFAFRGWVAYA